MEIREWPIWGQRPCLCRPATFRGSQWAFLNNPYTENNLWGITPPPKKTQWFWDLTGWQGPAGYRKWKEKLSPRQRFRCGCRAIEGKTWTGGAKALVGQSLHFGCHSMVVKAILIRQRAERCSVCDEHEAKRQRPVSVFIVWPSRWVGTYQALGGQQRDGGFSSSGPRKCGDILPTPAENWWLCRRSLCMGLATREQNRRVNHDEKILNRRMQHTWLGLFGDGFSWWVPKKPKISWNDEFISAFFRRKSFLNLSPHGATSRRNKYWN